MLKRVLSFGLAFLLGNGIQAAALLSHDCTAATATEAPKTAPESTSAATPAHYEEDDHACCPRPTRAAAVSEVNEADEVSCHGNPRDCCTLKGPAFGVLPTPGETAKPLKAQFVAAAEESMSSARDVPTAASDVFRSRVFVPPNSSLRL